MSAGHPPEQGISPRTAPGTYRRPPPERAELLPIHNVLGQIMIDHDPQRVRLGFVKSMDRKLHARWR